MRAIIVRKKGRGAGVVELGDTILQRAGYDAFRRTRGRLGSRRRRLRPVTSAVDNERQAHMSVIEVGGGGGGGRRQARYGWVKGGTWMAMREVVTVMKLDVNTRQWRGRGVDGVRGVMEKQGMGNGVESVDELDGTGIMKLTGGGQ